MRRIKILLCAVVFLTVSFTNSAGLTDAERRYAASLLQESKQTLLTKVKSLTPAQLAFKADSSSWSVAQCVEHIAITETGLFEFSQAALKTSADPSKRSEVKMTDEQVLKTITDRSSKFQAGEEVKPKGQFPNVEAALKAFTTSRDKHLSYVNSTKDDLRNHYNDFPFGKMDAYQTIIFMAGHCKRHTAQIVEITQHANFPKAER